MQVYRSIIKVDFNEFPTAVEEEEDGSIGYVWAWDNWQRGVIPIYQTPKVDTPEAAREMLASYEVYALIRDLVQENGYKTRRNE